MAGKVNFSDLETEGKTIINGSNITTGKIQGPDGKFYFDFSTGRSAVMFLVDANGNAVIYADPNLDTILIDKGTQITGHLYVGDYLTVYGNSHLNGLVVCSDDLVVNKDLTVLGDIYYSGELIHHI